MNYAAKFGKTNILTETRLSDNLLITPDISIWKSINYNKGKTNPTSPLLTMEITHSAQNDRYSDKTIMAAFQNFPTIQESFIYNYAKDTWTRYRRTLRGIEKDKNKDYSRVLNCYLHTLL